MTPLQTNDPIDSSIQKIGAVPAVLDLLVPHLPSLPPPFHNPRELLDSLLLEFDADHPAAVGDLLQVLSDQDSVEAPPSTLSASSSISLDGTGGDDASASASLLGLLSPQERAVLQLLGHGRSNREIAAALVLTVNTVKTHLRSLYRKLDVHTRLEAVARARACGLL